MPFTLFLKQTHQTLKLIEQIKQDHIEEEHMSPVSPADGLSVTGLVTVAVVVCGVAPVPELDVDGCSWSGLGTVAEPTLVDG